MAETDSQATFATNTKSSIRSKYNNRCAICLTLLTDSGSQCAHMLDRAGTGARQLLKAQELGTMPKNYQRSSAENGMVQCGSCHLGLFTYGHVVLSPPRQVLRYISNYLEAPGNASLHEVLSSLVEQGGGSIIPSQFQSPDPTSILPYLSLYTIIPLKSKELQNLRIPLNHFPKLSILENGKFIDAPDGVSPDDPNVARIFDVLSLESDAPAVSGFIPLSPVDSSYNEQRYWRIPIRLHVVLTMLLECVILLPGGCEEVKLAQAIWSKLTLREPTLPGLQNAVVERANEGRDQHDQDNQGGSGDGGPSGERGSGGDQGGSGHGGEKGDGRDDKGGGIDPKLKNTEFDDSRHDTKRKRGLNFDVEDSALTNSFVSDSGEADPEDWEFGPSFSTNRIILESRGQVLF